MSCAAPLAGSQERVSVVNEGGDPFKSGKDSEDDPGEPAELAFPFHVHMLRHVAGTPWRTEGMDTRRLQHYLGHASIRTL